MTREMKQQLKTGLEQLFADEDLQERNARIEAARITSTRLRALSKINLNRAVKPQQVKPSSTDMSLDLFRNWCKKEINP